MTDHEAIRSVETQWSVARARAQRASGVYAVLGCLGGALIVVPIALFATAVTSGPWRYVVMSATTLVLILPGVYAMWRDTIRQQARSNDLAVQLEQELTDAVASAQRESAERMVQVRRREFETRVANALEMAEDEGEVLGAVDRALASTLPDRPAEVLLADNSHAHLIRMALRTPTDDVPACPVESPDHCPAARRAQVQQFADSDELDSCPKLRDRAHGRCSAVCVPVSIMGRTVGVIHAIGEPGALVDDATVADLSTLSKLAGARIGLLRVMTETQLQAATDSLTGLLNRRSLENKARGLRVANTPVVVAMADLDHFKALNDKHGHETGDRALRLFAQVLRNTLRQSDLVARYGGEEFALVLPSYDRSDACDALNRVRAALADAIATAGLPRFTASFGVIEESDPNDDLGQLLTRADVALFDAKRRGRDRVVAHDVLGHVVSPPGGDAIGNGDGGTAQTDHATQTTTEWSLEPSIPTMG